VNTNSVRQVELRTQVITHRHQKHAPAVQTPQRAESAL